MDNPLNNLDKDSQKVETLLKESVTEPDRKSSGTMDSYDSNLFEEEIGLPHWVEKFNEWRRKFMSDYLFLLWLATAIGALAGFAAHIFNRLISILSNIFMRHIKPGEVNWWLIFIPIIGILIAGIYTRYIIHTNLTHGVTQLTRDIFKGKFLLKRNLIYSPIIGSTITLGFGGSAGSEGPIAYAGAAIGSNLGRVLGLKPNMIKVLIGCGAGAGISGIFMSPIGGLLFTLECLKLEIGTYSILAVTLACIVAYGIVFICNGCVPIHEFTPLESLQPEHYWSVLLLGLFCGLYSLYYSEAINRTDSFFGKITNPWIRNISGGLVIGICLLLFPALYGVGYPLMSETIHEHFNDILTGNIFFIKGGAWGMIIVAGCILILKCWACGSCNASGGVSSDFAPTLFAGGIAGFFFSMLANQIPGVELPVGIFTFLGMGAVMAGVIEAPLMTIFIVLNMGMKWEYAVAISLAVFSSYITVRACSHLRGYDNKVLRHLHWFHDHDNTTTTTEPTPSSK